VAKVLGNPYVNAVMIPLLLVLALNAWKLLARPDRRAPEDRMYGLDLVIAAAAYQFSELSRWYGFQSREPDPFYEFAINFSWIALGGLAVVMFVLVYKLRDVGYHEVGYGEWGVAAPLPVGCQPSRAGYPDRPVYPKLQY
jgi:hypothetical protein